MAQSCPSDAGPRTGRQRHHRRPFIFSCGLIYVGVMWTLAGGDDGGGIVIRILGLPMIGLGVVALRLWWRSFTRKVDTRLPPDRAAPA